MPTSQESRDILPLSEATFFILLSLTPAPKHGYAIMKDTRILSEGRVLLSTGTLYGGLKRLLESNWIERVDDIKGKDKRDRKAYALTRLGRRVLEAELVRLQGLVAVARMRTAHER